MHLETWESLQAAGQLWAIMAARTACSTSPAQHEELQTARCALLRAAGASLSDTLPALRAHAAALRKRGDVHAALGAALEMESLIGAKRRAGGDELSGQAAWWQVEQAKVLWALRQERFAVQVLNGLLERAAAAGRKLGGALLL